MSYRNVGDTLPIIQLSQEDVERSSTLEAGDAGKWCFILRGCLMGFYETRDEAKERVAQIMCD